MSWDLSSWTLVIHTKYQNKKIAKSSAHRKLAHSTINPLELSTLSDSEKSATLFWITQRTSMELCSGHLLVFPLSLLWTHEDFEPKRFFNVGMNWSLVMMGKFYRPNRPVHDSSKLSLTKLETSATANVEPNLVWGLKSIRACPLRLHASIEVKECSNSHAEHSVQHLSPSMSNDCISWRI